MIFDSHCHLLFYPEEERKNIVEEAKNNGVGILHTISTKLAECKDSIAICEKFPDVYCSVGVHPNHVEHDDSIREKLVSLAQHTKVISIGETGLDYYYNYTSKKDQHKSFVEHIRAAIEANLPIIVHSRNAETDTATILETEMGSHKVPVILHSFASSRELFKAALRNSWYVSFSGIVTFKNAREIQQIALDTPLNRMLIETDAPYLAPVPVRGRKNYPAYVTHVLSYLSKLKNIPSEELAPKLLENFLYAFKRIASTSRNL